MATVTFEKPEALQKTHATHLWVAPAVAALFYPLALAALFRSARLVHDSHAAGGGSLVGVAGFVVSLFLSLAVPALSLRVAYDLGRRAPRSALEARVRRVAHLAFASPPLFTLIGVVLYLLHAPWTGEYILWAVLWVAIAAAVYASRPVEAARPAGSTAAPRLATAHGLAALALLTFLLPHQANHVTGIWSPATHVEVMKALRIFYRNPLIEPLLVLAVLFQIVSGLVLFWRRSRQKSDLFGTLQTCAAVYLAVFLISHLNAVFVLGRWAMNVDTDFAFASGAPTGLLLDYWNIRLVIHYSLAVWSLFVHIACGARAVMLPRYTAAVANRMAWWIIGLGGLVALIAISGLSGFHLAPTK